MSDDVLHCGDALDVLRGMEAGSVQTCVTSPPYWGGLRDYGHAAQLGLERNPAGYVDTMSAVFAALWEVLMPDGVLWLNVGDAFAARGKGGGGLAGSRASWDTVRERKGFRMPPDGYKQKDLTLVPFLLADRLRRDGWYLRQTVVWSKQAATEPKRADRPSSSHEYLFMLAKSRRYAASDPGEPWWCESVWEIPSGVDPKHPATMPRELARRCLVCSSKPGDLVLDPFAGSCTTGYVALKFGRRFVGIELNPSYVELGRKRLDEARNLTPLFDRIPACNAGLFDAEAP